MPYRSKPLHYSLGFHDSYSAARWSCRQNRSAVVDQVLKTVRDNVQCRGINCSFIAFIDLQTFGSEGVVYLLLNA